MPLAIARPQWTNDAADKVRELDASIEDRSPAESVRLRDELRSIEADLQLEHGIAAYVNGYTNGDIRVWKRLHRIEEEIKKLDSPAQLKVDVEHHIDAELHDRSDERTALRRRVGEISKLDEPEARQGLLQLLHELHDRADRRHEQSEAVARWSMGLAIALLLAAIGLVVFQSRVDDPIVSLPSGVGMAGWTYLALMMSLGAVGGALWAVVNVVRKTAQPVTSSHEKIAAFPRIFLGVAIGAWTGVLGLALLGGAVLEITSLPAAFALAIGFGIVQEAVIEALSRYATAQLPSST
jgi:hypothetical protein